VLYSHTCPLSFCCRVPQKTKSAKTNCDDRDRLLLEYEEIVKFRLIQISPESATGIGRIVIVFLKWFECFVRFVPHCGNREDLGINHRTRRGTATAWPKSPWPRTCAPRTLAETSIQNDQSQDFAVDAPMEIGQQEPWQCIGGKNGEASAPAAAADAILPQQHMEAAWLKMS
jgi:hypothetical protein